MLRFAGGVAALLLFISAPVAETSELLEWVGIDLSMTVRVALTALGVIIVGLLLRSAAREQGGA